MAKPHNKKKVKGKKRKVKTAKRQFRQTVPKSLPSGVPTVGQINQPVPPQLRPIGTYIPKYKVAWSNPLAEKAAPVISKSWLKQQQADMKTTDSHINLKEALGMGTWASNITSWMEKQEKQMNTLSDLTKKITKRRTRRFRSSSESDSDLWSEVNYRVNEDGTMRGGPAGSSSGRDSEAERRAIEDENNRLFAEEEAKDADENPYSSPDELENEIEEIGSDSDIESGGARSPVYSGIGVTGGVAGASPRRSPRPDRPILAGGGAGEGGGAGAGASDSSIDLISLLKYTPEGKYSCYCGSVIKDSSQSITQHKKLSKKHRNYLISKGKNPDTYDQTNALGRPRGRPVTARGGEGTD